jgi:hypothetical protein
MTNIELPKVLLGTFGLSTTGTQDPIEIHWDNAAGDYYYLLITNMEEDPEYINDNIAASIAKNGGASRF